MARPTPRKLFQWVEDILMGKFDFDFFTFKRVTGFDRNTSIRFDTKTLFQQFVTTEGVHCAKRFIN